MSGKQSVWRLAGKRKDDAGVGYDKDEWSPKAMKVSGSEYVTRRSVSIRTIKDQI